MRILGILNLLSFLLLPLLHARWERDRAKRSLDEAWRSRR